MSFFFGKIRTKNWIKPCIYQHLPAQIPNLTGVSKTLYPFSLVNVVYRDVLKLSFCTPPAPPRTHKAVQKPACNNGAGRQKPKAKNQPSRHETETPPPTTTHLSIVFLETPDSTGTLPLLRNCPDTFLYLSIVFLIERMVLKAFGTDGWVDGLVGAGCETY